MTAHNEALRSAIEKLRLSIDECEADLRKRRARASRHVLRMEKIAAEEELARLQASLQRSNRRTRTATSA
jgi:hypothetical protein